MGDDAPEPTYNAPRGAVARLDGRLSLLVYHEGGVDAVHLEEGRACVIGRAEPSDLEVTDQQVSRQHARFVLEGTVVSVEDLGSTNGTWLDDRRVTRARLGAGDSVQLGSTRVFVHASGTGGTSPGLEGLAAPIVISRSMRELHETVGRLARARIPVLILGETGTGKEVIARALHDRGPRSDRPLRCVNCGAIPSQLLESTLFGHEKGAFTGATQRTAGVFEAANGGTVFLDEIGELGAGAQAALLRVLETQTVARVGSTEELAVDVRVVAATHRDLEVMCASGAFRRDLFYRLNAMTLRVPPLRERPEEIIPLAERFLLAANRANGTSVTEIDAQARAVLTSYRWPGNVRELKNAVDRAVVIARGASISVVELPEALREAVAPAAETAPGIEPLAARADDSVDDFRRHILRLERALIKAVLLGCRGNRTEAARKLSMPLRTLMHKLSNMDLEAGSEDDREESKRLLAELEARVPRSNELGFRARISAYEEALIREALSATSSPSEAARRLRMAPRTLSHKLRALGIEDTGR
ncbi:MAG: sigma 54-interacting transcriptional regulator [Deltaproteobacteria bacterium]|nr:sigma 54-interacting transcriptional regulator [Deltaproteobacteria bacterium]